MKGIFVTGNALDDNDSLSLSLGRRATRPARFQPLWAAAELAYRFIDSSYSSET